jgi:putative endonuclease
LYCRCEALKRFKLEKNIMSNDYSKMRSMFVYILRCSDNSLYIGVTNNYRARFDEHQNGINSYCYTFKRRPLQLVYLEEFNEPIDAIFREKQLKKWSRAKKEALINGNDSLLWRLSENHTNLITTRHRRHGELAEP